MALPQEVVLSIQRVLNLQPGDKLDNLGRYDPLDSLNDLFPDEDALLQIEAIQSKLRQKELEVEAEIESLSTELRQNRNPESMQIIQEMIAELFFKMNRIREKAAESEAIVQNITKDIQSLDLAKKNLTNTMTALKRFQMLMNALAQLEVLIEAVNYSEIAQSLAAIKEISAFFKDYRAIDQIAFAWRRMQELQGKVRTVIEEDFEKFLFPDKSKPIKISTVVELCGVADVLGEDVRNHLIDKYCSTELREYKRIFRPSDEAGQLDNIPRRFSWFRRILKLHDDEHVRAFPAHWKVGQVLCVRFMDITKDDLTVVLNAISRNLTVTLLLEALQHTLDFEAQICQKYSVTMSQISQTATASVVSFKPSSSAFEPHMSIYIDAQDKALTDLLAPHRSSKGRSSLDETSAGSDSLSQMLPSSTELFYFYAQNLEQCQKLTTGKPLYELCALYKKWLRLYAEDVLAAEIKRPERDRKSIEKINSTSIVHICRIINTTEYCQKTTAELEEKIKERIDEDFKEQISLQTEIDYFMGIISTGIIALLGELDAACYPHFAAMLKIPFGAVENVSGQSAYMTELTLAVESVVELVRISIQTKKYLRNFYDKSSNLLLLRFTNALVKSRPLREFGAEQLLIDLQSLKASLLKLPGPTVADSSVVTSHAKSVTKATSQLETLLKVINAPTDPQAGFVTNYMVFIGDASFSNFQKVLDLKGTPRTEQNSLQDLFLTMTSTQPDLESSSFLSSLDMEPASTQLISTTAAALGRTALPSIFTGQGKNLDGTPSASFLGSFTPPSRASAPAASGKAEDAAKKTGFVDLRRFVTFGARRDTQSGSQ